MEERSSRYPSFIHKLSDGSSIKIFSGILVVALFLGIGSGYLLASGGGQKSPISLIKEAPKSATQDTQTFRDFAEGKVTKKPDPKKGAATTPGTHLLIRDGADPVTLTSSVVDLATYENKKVKVFGETQQVPGAAWFMDVGKVEEEQ